jgi:adenylate cyclase
MGSLMEPEQYAQKLVAILYADVAGYSRLTGEDEVGTHRILSTYLDLFTGAVEHHSGKVVHYAGDAILADFDTVSHALICAVNIQQDLEERNKELPDEKQVRFRIGVNLGEVIVDRDDIYGDGVNVAARLESLAEPGGVCVSEAVRAALGTKLPLEYEFLGEQEVKNIREPVRAYHARLKSGAVVPLPAALPKSKRPSRRYIAAAAVLVIAIGAGLLAWLEPWLPREEPASIERMAYPLPGKPSIAVLPFTNMSGDTGQEYFSDGLTEDIITNLARFPDLFVIARNSTFTYKGQPVKVTQVAEELGVRYVLEGSVQTAGDKMRITAQLIDATTGHHLWAENYDRKLGDIFAVRDEVTQSIVSTLMGSDYAKLRRAELERLALTDPANLDAYELVLRAIKIWLRFTKEANTEAGRLARRAIELDPGYARAYSSLAWVYLNEHRYEFSDDPEQSLERAFEMALKSIELDDADEWSYWSLGVVYLYQGKYEESIAEYEKALARNPNDADVLADMATPLTFAGQPEQAISRVKQAMRLNPNYPPWYAGSLGLAYVNAKRYEAAIAPLMEESNRYPGSLATHRTLAVAYFHLGKLDDARREVEALLKIDPQMSIEGVRLGLPFKHERDLELFLDGLRKAGLPERPPLALPDKPSIAVLPFANMSGDAEQEYLSDGISENIITELSRFRELFVIARQSSFSYKGKPVTIQQISNELGVRYVVEGSLQRSGDRVRVTVQLIDALDGMHLWAERYDRHLTDVFAIQDEIVRAVVASLAEEVQMAEGEHALRKHPRDLKAFEYVLSGRKLLRIINKESTEQARQMYEKAREIDPNDAGAYAGLAKVYNFAYRWRFLESVSRETAVKLSCEMAQKAVALEPFWYRGHWALANCHMFREELDQSLIEYERALELNPNSSEVRAAVGEPLVYLGRAEEAIVRYKAAIRLNPHHPDWFLWQMGWAQYMVGQYEEALATIKRMNRMPNAAPRLPQYSCVSGESRKLGSLSLNFSKTIPTPASSI